jgi:hypothetical protein
MAGNATLNMVLVLDGLRRIDHRRGDPDLWRLRQEGVNFLSGIPSSRPSPAPTRPQSHRHLSERNGIFGNTLYVREVNPNRAFPMTSTRTC